MATRALIGMQVENGIKTMYCHFDGYLAHVGTILLTHYTDPAKVAELVELGYVSTLGHNPVVAEHTDGGSSIGGGTNCTAANTRISPTLLCGAGLSDLWDEDGQEWEYLFTLQGSWLCRTSSGGKSAGTWYPIHLVDGVAKAPAPTKAPAPAPVPTVDPDSFLGIFARLGDLPASKRAKVLPALKALLEMAEG